MATNSYLDIARRALSDDKPAESSIERPEATTVGAEVPDAVAAWQAALDRLEGDPDFPPAVMNGLQTADVRWADDEPEGDRADDDLEVIDPPDPCAACGGIMFWWNPLGQPRCINCHPPGAVLRLIERVKQIRRRHARRSYRKAAPLIQHPQDRIWRAQRADSDPTDKQADSKR